MTTAPKSDAPAAHEPLADLTALGLAGRNHYAHPHNPPYWAIVPGAVDVLLARRGVAERLAAVEGRVRQAGLRLWIYDAWRPRAVQAYFHDVWMPARLRAKDPALDGAALWAAVEQYWSAPTSDPCLAAPHETGGAVDVTLTLPDGHPLWMGSLFDDPASASHLDHFERQAPVSASDEEARANRRLLYWVMTEAGFAAYPEEWWHFSYGDRLWAAVSDVARPLYPAAAP